jgi:hypothetical protein
MEIWIGDESSPRSSPGALDNHLVEAAAPLPMRVVLAPDEELVDIQLSLHAPTSTSPPVFSAPTIATSAGGLLSNVTWLTADWGSSRTLASVALKPTDLQAKHKAQIQIARGASGWYSPPGPHSFALVTNTTINVGFPNTIADRLMIELMVDGAPTACTLEQPSVTFGHVARNPTVALAGERPLFEHTGDVNADIPIDRLLESLQRSLPLPLRNQTFTLEIGAAAAGRLKLSWALTIVRVLEHFDTAGQQSTLSLALDWSTPAVATLPITAESVFSLRLSTRWTPSNERAVLAPEPTSDVSTLGAAGLVRPRYEQAQCFRFVPTGPLTGVDLWVRAPQQGLAIELTVTIVEDRGGIPDAAAVATASLSLAAGNSIGSTPSWLRVDLGKPLALAAERWWVVVRVDAGELAWILATPSQPRTDVGSPRYRRDEGAWLERDAGGPNAWAMTRLRALDPTPAPAPTLQLIVGETEHNLSPSSDDPAVFELSDSLKANGASLALRTSSVVAGQLELGELELRWQGDVP